MNTKYTGSDLEPACFYLRKSREDQEAEARGEGETLSKHKRELFRVAKAMDVNIAKVFEEIVSGESVIHRPEMMQLLKEVGEGSWHSVFCIEVDRLGRGDMEDQGLILKTFKNANTLIVTPRKVYNLNDEFDEEYTEFEAFMARKELKIITRRLQNGRIRSVQDGNYIGTRAPYGYQIEKNGRDRILVPHPDQADVIRLIFDLYTNDDPNIRMGSRKIANELNRLGKRTYTGKPWEYTTVLFILKNEVYTGRLQWKKVEAKKSKTPGKRRDVRTRPRDEWINAPGKHEALISDEIFKKAQAILKDKYHVPYQLVNGITNPLAGLIRCGKCGASMVYRPYTKQSSHIKCYNNPKCDCRSTRFDLVEARLLEGLSNWITEYESEWLQNKPPAFDPGENVVNIKKRLLKNLTTELKNLEQQKERLFDLLERQIYDEATYLERSKSLTERIKQAETAMSETEDMIREATKREKARKEIIPAVKKVLKAYQEAPTPSLKNDMLKTILDHAIYQKEKDQVGENFSLILYPKVPK